MLNILKTAYLSIALLISFSVDATEPISVIDYAGNKINLDSTAKRIIALSPHIVENIFSAGAGELLVGVVAYSDFPEAAKTIKQIGSNNLLNFESIISMQPDLIIAWQSGNTNSSLKRLKDLGFNIYLDEPKSLDDIAKSIMDIGVLVGTSDVANPVAKYFLAELNDLRNKNLAKEKISVFYEVWNQPLQTLNGQHLVSTAIELCSGTNIFAELPNIAPIINIESIIQRDPQVIIASGASNNERPQWLNDWEKWPKLTAVKNQQLFHVPADHLVRHTTRIIKGIRTICTQLDLARNKPKL